MPACRPRTIAAAVIVGLTVHAYARRARTPADDAAAMLALQTSRMVNVLKHRFALGPIKGLV